LIVVVGWILGALVATGGGPYVSYGGGGLTISCRAARESTEPSFATEREQGRLHGRWR
jgi:hypothetical protein